MQRQDVQFAAEGGVMLRGWLFTPDGPGPHPGITMAHGFAGVKEPGLERFARHFAEAGFVVLLHDHRGFGAREGTPRGDVNPWTQIADWRHAISFLEEHPTVDADRIGLWGTSYAGGHAIVLGATDRRLRAVDPAILTTTRNYLLDAQRLLAGNPTPREYFDHMTRLHPDRLNVGPVWCSAVALLS